jgi:hypothetical protein
MRKSGALAVDYHYSARVGSCHKKQQVARRNEINTDFVTFSAQSADRLTGCEAADETTDE